MSIQVNIAIQHNRIHVAKQLIASLEKQSVKPNAVLLILQGCDIDIKTSLNLKIIKNEFNKGASERFKYLGQHINLIIDDDFVVSKDYIKTALNGLERHPKAVCSFWGFAYHNKESFIGSWSNIDCWSNYINDTQCKRIGCGLSIFDESAVRLSDMEWQAQNYNDMQLASYAINSGLELWKIAHSKGIAIHDGTASVQVNALWKNEKHNLEFIQNQHKLIYEKSNLLSH
jgi:hypothetical protein